MLLAIIIVMLGLVIDSAKPETIEIRSTRKRTPQQSKQLALPPKGTLDLPERTGQSYLDI
jgi:hypothetical protein